MGCVPEHPFQPFRAIAMPNQERSQATWDSLAANLAFQAHEHFEVPGRELRHDANTGIVYIDSIPYGVPKEKSRRESLLLRLRGFLSAGGFTEKGCAYYPETGDMKDLVFAMIIDATESQLPFVNQGFRTMCFSFDSERD